MMPLVRTGTVSDNDYLGRQTYELADGSTLPSPTFRIRSLKVGNVVMKNLAASITPATGEPLLGQGFSCRLKGKRNTATPRD